MKMQPNNSILVLGDSLSFGRPKYNIGRFDTWPFLLSQKLDSDLIFRSNGGSRVVDVIHQARSLYGYWFDSSEIVQPFFDAIFIQVGLCEVVPRLGPLGLYPILFRIPAFRKLERYRNAYKLFGKPWTSPRDFSANASKLVDICRQMSTRVFFLQIADPCNYLSTNIGDFSPMVREHNEILRSVADSSLISWCEEVDASVHILPDGQHLSSAGHRLIVKTIIKAL